MDLPIMNGIPGTLRTTDDIFSWLSSFISLETGLGGKPDKNTHFKLDRIKILSNLAGNPESCAPVIHIAGTKGKGSVTAMAGSALEAAGIKTARYMSPHISDWRERISRGDGAFFPDSVYVKAGQELQRVYNEYKRLSQEPDPTFFELATVLFFLCARMDNCKAMVVETGLGGRLDATNIVDPAVSVITLIEKEHTEYLGTTLAAIAAEKAGIIKQGRLVIAAKQQKEVFTVLRQTAKKTAAPFLYAPDCAAIKAVVISKDGTDFTLKLKAGKGKGLHQRFSLAIHGAIQAENAALALLAVSSVFPHIDKASMEKGLASCRLPARFEKLRANPPFIVDGAHTPFSAAQCVETFCGLYGKGILLFGCAADKDAHAMAAVLFRHFKRCIITAPGSVRASDPESVYRSFFAAAQQHGALTRKTKPDIICIPDTATAIQESLRLSEENNSPVLCCGSFYLAADVRKSLNPSVSRIDTK
jgi:dihydrofolate synthase/folylpolyglutamate synthase